jgi:2-amino-4-hydroxy-6-hydroxymethyldihydropteridine diphosphokinase
MNDTGTAKPVRAFLGLGSNMGDRHGLLATAVDELPGIYAVSGLYQTAPVGGPIQEPYFNLVAEIHTHLSPYDLLHACQDLEKSAGRVRLERWGPRTLDIDILLYGQLQLGDPDLTVPHPRMYERAFVLHPLAELAPELLPENWESAVAEQSIQRLGDWSLFSSSQ